ncbi:PREDICTED: perilipin-2-like [Nanorana parkeri]|uniref:perilipin-2-like n=1 Tax=Nanorana parkeri TaxID=125878 RepID=UPI0008547E2D|nr:PREDICTED: perilipin-2-like [Nanorana parkeri]
MLMVLRCRVTGGQPAYAEPAYVGFTLVQSAYQIASFAYRDVKNVHPAVGYFCEVSERGAKAASDLAAIGVSPLLKAMEPQIAAANNVALQVVDQLEKKLPVLDQPADEVVSEFRERLVSGVRTVRDRALDRVQNVVDRTRAVGRESYEAVSIVASFLETLEVRDMVKVSVYFVVTQAEDLVDRYLPEESDISLGLHEDDDGDTGQASLHSLRNPQHIKNSFKGLNTCSTKPYRTQEPSAHQERLQRIECMLHQALQDSGALSTSRTPSKD